MILEQIPFYFAILLLYLWENGFNFAQHMRKYTQKRTCFLYKMYLFVKRKSIIMQIDI